MSNMASKLMMIAGILLLDVFLYYFLRKDLDQSRPGFRITIIRLFWVLSLLVLACFWHLDWIFLNVEPYSLRKAIIGFLGVNFAIKLILAIYVILNRLVIGVTNLYQRLFAKLPIEHNQEGKHLMSRNRFIRKVAVLTASLPLAVKGFNIINRAYDYQLRKERIILPHLPKAFHGLTVGQISDIHTGSFTNKSAVKGGVDLLMQEKADLVFFTGDLVNQQSDEAKEYFDVFKKIKAPLGVYSILGNHDYGDYRSWSTAEARKQNFEDMLSAHKELGWQLLRNENRLLQESGESLAILGVENWGIKRFSKYGNIKEAYQGSQEAAVKLLLSHDPSHWDAQVLGYQDIDVTFSGHTHGFQFGVEIGDFRWSPSQYLYKQWAGLYQEGGQYLYVNRGYGFIGIPGRIGINPEVTVFELLRA